MAKRHPRENILVQWTVDEAEWNRFLAASEARRQQRDQIHIAEKKPAPFPVEGVECVIRDDALFVGKRCVWEFVYTGGAHWMGMYETWLEILIPSDGDPAVILIPVPARSRSDVRRVVEAFQVQDREAARIQAELDARPTFINGLRRWVEARPMLTIIGFFVVVIPLIVAAISLLRYAFPTLFKD